MEVIKTVQAKFAREIKSLGLKDCNSDRASRLKGDSEIYQLDSFLDKDGVLRAGGRLHKSYLNDSCKPPVLLPKEERVSLLIIKQRRSQVKRYGAMFTFMSCRAVHIEITNSLTDSFILALRHLIAIRGNVQTIFSDNGGNFIGSENELRWALEEMDKEKLQSFMQASGSDWVTWKRNPPYASHMGGVWDRHIHSARSILSSLMQTYGRSLDEESLATPMAETRGNLEFLTFDN